MRRSAAFAAAGAVALLAGFTITHSGIQDRTPAGHRASSQTLPAVGSFTPSTTDESRLLAEIEQREAERLETEHLERVVREEAEAREAEAAELARVAAVRAEKGRKAAEAISTPSTVRAAPVARTPAVSSGNTSGVDINCESGGDYAANTGNGFYGAYQWVPSTFRTAMSQALSQGKVTQATYDDWAGVRPDRVPPWVQDAAAAAHVAAGYRGAWPNC